MREHLYRGKRVANGKWVEGFYAEPTRHWHKYGIHKAWIITSAFQNGGFFNVMGRHAVLPETVGEYTGLTDKNGKKIFDGDIVKCYRYLNGKDGELVFENLVVVWDEMNACFSLVKVGVGYTSYRYNDYEMDDTHEFEVIGNKFDNPELLEE